MTSEFPTTPSSSFLRSHCFRRRGPVTRRGRRAWARTSAWTTPRGAGRCRIPAHPGAAAPENGVPCGPARGAPILMACIPRPKARTDFG